MSEIQLKSINTDSVDIAIQESDKTLQAVQAIDIKDQASYESVANIRKIVNAKIKELDSQRKEITIPIDQAKKKVMELFKKPMDTCKQVLDICDVLMIAYTDMQEKKRKAEQDRLDRAAEKKRKDLEAKAEKAKEEGKEGKAEQYEEKAAEVIPPTAAPRVEKPQGVHYTEKWSGEVTDISILPREYMVPDCSKINKVCQATKGTLSIPGVTITKKRIVNSRS